MVRVDKLRRRDKNQPTPSLSIDLDAIKKKTAAMPSARDSPFPFEAATRPWTLGVACVD